MAEHLSVSSRPGKDTLFGVSGVTTTQGSNYSTRLDRSSRRPVGSASRRRQSEFRTKGRNRGSPDVFRRLDGGSIDPLSLNCKSRSRIWWRIARSVNFSGRRLSANDAGLGSEVACRSNAKHRCSMQLAYSTKWLRQVQLTPKSVSSAKMSLCTVP